MFDRAGLWIFPERPAFDKLMDMLDEMYHPDDKDLWLSTVQEGLGDKTPLEAIKEGRTWEVLDLLENPTTANWEQ